MTNLNLKVKATANIKKNRLVVTVQGNVDQKSLEKLYTEIRFCVADLKPGFEVISDISQCNLIYISGLPVYKKIIDYLVDNKVGKIVRIIKNDNVSFKQIVNFSEKIQFYRTLYAEDQQEAEHKLNTLIRRDGIRFTLNSLVLAYTADERLGTGELVDISTSGCSVKAPTVPVAVGGVIEMTIRFEQHQTLVSVFQAKAQIVRADTEGFAAQFMDVDDTRKEALYNRLAHEFHQISFVL